MTKQDLKRYQSLVKEIRHLKQQLKMLQDSQIDGVRTSSFHERMRGGHAPYDITAERTVHRLDKERELIQLYEAKIDELIRFKMKIEKAVWLLEDPCERDLIRYYYFEGLNWYDVADLVGYEVRQIHRMHRRVMQKLVDLEEV